MAFLVSLAEIRDVFIIIYGVIGIIFFFIASIVTILIGLTARALLRSAQDMLNDSVKPAVTSIRDAAETVRGTTEFVGKTAVTPIVRGYGIAAGVKRGIGMLAGFRRGR
jgi:hypothetical protein